ncbi:flagellar hook-length control protein FliK [Thermaerobacter subterraneus]|uniref:Flagellar hook-length control protein n=1 Tax=Thermaerobacter subterraneus DSM 13965 TaxID=867903 RepID=K6QBF4_9FIRM|nr:flagellar hook-length control protein FliK [Thermaerobacter subterraneus]EKP93676.1 flagellar hook-length control protein [Thermaerobacter subterraneus DSM 13965]
MASLPAGQAGPLLPGAAGVVVPVSQGTGIPGGPAAAQAAGPPIRGEGEPLAPAAAAAPGMASPAAARLPGAAGGGPVDAGRWAAAVARWIEGLEWHRTGDRHRLRLELAPAHLGPLHVEVAGDGSVLAARLTVFHPDTLALVQRHLDELRQALTARGYQIQGLEVGLAAGGAPGQAGQQGPGGQGGPGTAWAWAAGGVPSAPGPGPGDVPSAGPGTAALPGGGRGRLDVRI